ncbi:MAG: hypothetical protein ACYCOO_00870 [Chitinophagaceae bacterium]
MVRQWCFTCSLIFISLVGVAQQTSHRTYLKVNPTTLINELDLYLEQELNASSSLEFSVGGIYTDYWDYLLNQTSFGQIKPNIRYYQYTHARGLSGRVGYRYYIIPSYQLGTRARGTYFEPIFLFKKLWYPNNKTTINQTDYWERANKYVMGLQLLVGRESHHGKFVFDRFIGLGVRAKTYRFNSLNTSGPSPQTSNNRTTNWLPNFNLGIKIGIEVGHPSPLTLKKS